MTNKYSYGIALCRKKINKELEVLAIKKRYTYHFYIFILGKYKATNFKFIERLLNNISHSEKIDILSLNFDILWYKIWLSCPNENNKINHLCNNIKEYYTEGQIKSIYWSKRKRFEEMVKDGGHRLKQMIINSANSEVLWEIPKGRSSGNETHLETAIREFYEETNIHEKHYNICYNIEPIIHAFSDEGVNYIYKYFVAIISEDYKFDENNIKFNYRNSIQIGEVEQIKWINSNDITLLLTNKKNINGLLRLYDNIKKQYNKNKLKSFT